MAFTISPNMALIIPGVGTEAGPTYATDVNNSLTIIDGHSHVAGAGVLITPAAININASLPMNNNYLMSTAAITLTPQTITPANGSLYEFGVDLHYIDGSGNNIQITSGGVVNATSSGISSGTATASFVGGVLVVNSAPLTPANVQGASFLFGNNVANSFYLTLQPPNAMGANYTLTLPTLPAQTNVMTLDITGNMGSVTWDTVGQNMTSVGANALYNSRTVTVGQIVTQGGVAKSPNCGSFGTASTSLVFVTNLEVELVGTGRPIQISLIADRTSFSPAIFSGSNNVINVQVQIGGFSVYNTQISTGSGNSIVMPASIIQFLDFPGAGTWVYQVFISSSNGSSINLQNAILTAYEI